LSKLEGVLPLSFQWAKLYYIKRDISLNYVSELFNPEFLTWSQAWKVFFVYFGGILLSSAIASAVFSLCRPFSLRGFGDQLLNQADSGSLNWCLYSKRHSDILVERKVGQPIISDIIKSFLQSCTNKPIIWRPLEDPFLPLSSGKVKISWLRVSGVSFPVVIFDD
jgi:hypothetical protein